MLSKCIMYVHKAIKEFMVLKGVGEAARDLDVDTEVGTIFVKTRTTADAPIVVHDLNRKVEGSKLALRTHICERIKGLIAASKGLRSIND